MSASATLIAAAIGVPMALLLVCASPSLRRRMPALFAVAPLPAVAAAMFGARGSTFTLGDGCCALRFSLDAPGAMLLGAAAVLWAFAGLYAARDMRDRPDSAGFNISWLMTLTGCIGVFLAADLISFYFLLAVLSVGASGLVLQGEGREALRASAVYLGLALFAEAVLLAGLILLAQATPGGSLLISDAAAALPNSPWRDATLLLLLIGLGIKAGMMPLHFWMPVAYDAAPIPAAAVMSGAAVKASVLAMIRFLPLGTPLPDFGYAMVAIGLFGAFYGVVIGITQMQPKVILAYSSVSQMGFLVAVIGMGLAAGDAGSGLVAAFYAAHHLLVKGALFLAVGTVVLTGARRLRSMLVPAAIIALGLGGLPLTGGALAKDAAKGLMGVGWAASLAIASSIATTLLMIHFLRRLSTQTAPDPDARAPTAISGAWLVTALAALVVPWALYVAIPIGTLAEALAPTALWSAFWPVLAGAALALGSERLAVQPPGVPAGDVGAVMRPLVTVGLAAGNLLDSVDVFTRRWFVSTTALLLISLVFSWALRTVN